MACPYFYPVEARAQPGQNAMLPLGDAWAGVCRADPHRPWQPDEAILRPLCNLGYARGNCARFPAPNSPAGGPDAVRFSVSDDDGACLRIYLVVESDHLPYAHRPLEYSRASGAFLDPPPDETISRQARAYVESYLRRKSEAFDR
jgi:hypothetical protein